MRGPLTGVFQMPVWTVLSCQVTSRGRPTLTESKRPIRCISNVQPMLRPQVPDALPFSSISIGVQRRLRHYPARRSPSRRRTVSPVTGRGKWEAGTMIVTGIELICCGFRPRRQSSRASRS